VKILRGMDLMVVGVFTGVGNSGNFPEYYALPSGTDGAARRQHS